MAKRLIWLTGCEIINMDIVGYDICVIATINSMPIDMSNAHWASVDSNQRIIIIINIIMFGPRRYGFGNSDKRTNLINCISETSAALMEIFRWKKHFDYHSFLISILSFQLISLV